VTDFAKARHFWKEVVGLQEEFAFEDYGWAQFVCGGVPICIYVSGQGGGDREPGGETGIQLRLGDAKAAFEFVEEHTVGGLIEGDDGTISFQLRDPDGNLVQVLQFA
jgi:catechol 2,3-dioxygenase-like lactoylglutathione lyase family enzyme